MFFSVSEEKCHHRNIWKTIIITHHKTNIFQGKGGGTTINKLHCKWQEEIHKTKTRKENMEITNPQYESKAKLTITQHTIFRILNRHKLYMSSALFKLSIILNRKQSLGPSLFLVTPVSIELDCSYFPTTHRTKASCEYFVALWLISQYIYNQIINSSPVNWSNLNLSTNLNLSRLLQISNHTLRVFLNVAKLF